ncbi:EAL domain-containing protein, partial [Acidocella facilis]|uniref:EAL domain-containing protein n=1 Tax=Acidocella facilis TaxID=525 RepID=UPI001F204A5B
CSINSSEIYKVIIGSIIELGHKLGTNVVAEGVEDVGQLRFLRENYCDEGQGFLFSPPIGAELFSEMLSFGSYASAGKSRS